ncbi:MAG: hypothetical protein GC138_03415 [Gammaproteobacteria bacterium]|nr:hypothetical protein [Gammaproteobacteria bacterium]
MASGDPESSLTLIVPGLLDPDVIGRGALPDAPRALATLLSRANIEPFPGSGPIECIARLAPQLTDALETTAALRYLDDTGRIPAGYCLAADPIHLQVGREQIIMGRHQGMDITPDEAGVLRALLEADITRQGIRLEITKPDHWYLFPSIPPESVFASGRDLSGQGIRDHMPTGPDAGPWRALISDAQILLHDCALNGRRATEGKLPINSLWRWGGGVLQALPDTRPPWSTAASDDSIVRGLARLAGCERVAALPEAFGAAPFNSSSLIAFEAMDQLDIESRWQTVLKRENNWFLPILDALSKKVLAELNLIPTNGKRYRVTPRLARRWWKRARPLQRFA